MKGKYMILDYNFLKQYILLNIIIFIIGIIIDVTSTYLGIKAYNNKMPKAGKVLSYSIVFGEKITSFAFSMIKFIPIIFIAIIIF